MSSESSQSLSGHLLAAGQALGIGGTYIALSAGLISFNKYVLSESIFPHALELTVLHMAWCTFCSMSLYTVVPSIYPSMDRALAQKGTVLKYITPLGLLFALALFCSNKAYTYCSIAFLQFLKEGNVALIFFMSCALGLQSFSMKKFGVLAILIFGCSMCVEGEIHFVLLGFLIQLTSQFAECAKNVLGEIIMTGQGLKLDPLTFVAFQAPCSLLPLLVFAAAHPNIKAFHNLQTHAGLLMANASVAFLLNVMIAITLKRLSALAFVIIGLAKDIVIVLASAVAFGDHISNTQRISFGITLFGMALWAHLKLQDQAAAADELKKKEQAVGQEVSETTPLVDDVKKSEMA